MKTGDFLFRFVFYSLLLHIVILGYFIIDPGFNFFSKKNLHVKNAIRVDTIGLPELKQKYQPTMNSSKKKELALPSKPPAPKVKKPEKEKKAPTKVPTKAPTKTAVKKKKPVFTKNKEPKKTNLTQKKKPEKTKIESINKEQNQAMEKIKQLKNIEKAQTQAIEKLEAMDSINKIKQELENNQRFAGERLSKGSANKGELDFYVLQYFTSVKAHINMYWNLPQELANKKLRAEIYTEINETGHILKGKIIKSSGNEDFDARVLETLQRASPFPKPPNKDIQKMLLKGVVFKFPE